MPIPTERILDPQSTRCFGRQASPPLPPLTDLQTRAYERFLQPDTPPEQRIAQGLEGVLREAFPIRSHDGFRSLAYMHYDLGPPAYSLEECRRLRLTYARPLRVWLRMDGPEPIAEPVNMGAVPILLDGGEFLINGSTRVVIGQLQRAPGIEFSASRDGDSTLHSFRIIPQRGPRLEIHVTRRDTLEAHLGRGLKLPALTLLRALDPCLSTDRELLAALHPVKTLDLAHSEDLVGAISAEDVIDRNTGDVLLEAGSSWTSSVVEQARARGIDRAMILDGKPDGVLLDSLAEDRSRSHESALVEIYRRLRRGLPLDLDRARQVLAEQFTLPNRFTLGAVGRQQINRKLDLSTPIDDLALRGSDLAAAIRCLFDLRAGKGEVDESEHLANRRVRLLDELLTDELRKGLLKLRRVVQDRMQRAGGDRPGTASARSKVVRPRELVQHRAVSATLDYFFARSEMSQIVDQTNPLAQLTHARRLTAIGPGGVDRKRASFRHRDLHLSHHGRIRPVETPEGEVIGLILHLAMYAALDEQGFLVTPHHEVVQGRIQQAMTHLRPDEEERLCVAPGDVLRDSDRIKAQRVIARCKGDFVEVAAEEVTHIGVSPQQMVGVSAGLIPFLEHDDANRALMGIEGRKRPVDLVKLTHSAGETYSFNLLSIGFTADVGALTNRRFKALGHLGYLLGVFVCVAKLNRRPFALRCDDDKDWDERRALFLTFNNSKFTGGTMMIAPNADPSDGAIEFVRWGPIGRLGLLRMLPKLYDGTHIQHPLASRRAVRHVDFNIPTPVDVMIDGEIVSLTCKSLDILPSALDVFI